jgi:uncharacterized protein involved in type VI secretion and phage assembly
MFFQDNLEYENKNSKIYGVVPAVVTNNKDEEGLARIKVTFPWLAENDESYWARIATLMAGNDRGTYFIPEIGDEVLVAFENGDIHYPYILGAIYNGKDKPHETNSDGKNNLRVIKSRSGHKVIFDDTQGNEKVTLIDKDGNREITLDSKQKTIDIKNNDGDVNIKVGGNLNIDVQKNIKITSGAETSIKASANTIIKGSLIKLN